MTPEEKLKNISTSERGHVAEAMLQELDAFLKDYESYTKDQLLQCNTADVDKYRIMFKAEQNLVGYLKDKIADAVEADKALAGVADVHEFDNTSDFYNRLGVNNDAYGRVYEHPEYVQDIGRYRRINGV